MRVSLKYHLFFLLISNTSGCLGQGERLSELSERGDERDAQKTTGFLASRDDVKMRASRLELTRDWTPVSRPQFEGLREVTPLTNTPIDDTSDLEDTVVLGKNVEPKYAPGTVLNCEPVTNDAPYTGIQEHIEYMVAETPCESGQNYLIIQLMTQTRDKEQKCHSFYVKPELLEDERVFQKLVTLDMNGYFQEEAGQIDWQRTRINLATDNVNQSNKLYRLADLVYANLALEAFVTDASGSAVSEHLEKTIEDAYKLNGVER